MKRYWLRGGLILGIFGLITGIPAVMAFFLPDPNSLMIFWFIHPIMQPVGMGLAMRGDPASSTEIFTSISMGIIFSVSIYFIIGAILGIIYGKIRSNKILLIAFALAIIFIPVAYVYINTTPNTQNFSTVDECDNPATQSRKGFNKNTCYFDVAVKAGNLTICDKLKDSRASNGKGACYSEIAIAKSDYGICNMIVEDDLFKEDEYLYASQKQQCINQIALKRGDCDMIPSVLSNFKESCQNK